MAVSHMKIISRYLNFVSARSCHFLTWNFLGHRILEKFGPAPQQNKGFLYRGWKRSPNSRGGGFANTATPKITQHQGSLVISQIAISQMLPLQPESHLDLEMFELFLLSLSIHQLPHVLR